MSPWRATRVVAGWEFRRFFKWKDQLLGLALFGVLGVIWAGVAAVAGTAGGAQTVALAGTDLGLEIGTSEGRLGFVAGAADEAARLAALERDEVQGVLSRRPDGTFELVVAKDPRYRTELVTRLTEALQRERLAALGLTPADLDRVLAPPEIEVRFLDPQRGRRGKAEKITGGVAMGLMLMAIFTSLAYLLTGITGEKQLRVTESVVAAIPPQSWIDGKVLGITAHSLASTANLLVGGLVVAGVGHWASGLEIPTAALRPGFLVVLGLFTLLGLLLWNSFFAAVAATVDDPNNSSRSVWMFLPLLPMVLSIVVIKDPDSLFSRILAVFPLTSAPALPVRMIFTDVGLVEIAVAVLFLVVAIWIARRLAGRIFEIGMLLYGKEPTIAEVLRWARAGRPGGG